MYELAEADTEHFGEAPRQRDPDLALGTFNEPRISSVKASPLGQSLSGHAPGLAEFAHPLGEVPQAYFVDLSAPGPP